MQVTIRTHKGILFRDSAERAAFLAGSNVISVGDDHQPMVCAVGKGLIRLFGVGPSRKRGAISVLSGVAYVSGDELKILAETA